ncbi:MAG: hypothetical protein V3T48_04195 [Vicinamibacterales bacterium]
MTLSPGTTLGPYAIVSQLGSGGMGEARPWVTWDTGLETDEPAEEPPVQTCAACGRGRTR